MATLASDWPAIVTSSATTAGIYSKHGTVSLWGPDPAFLVFMWIGNPIWPLSPHWIGNPIWPPSPLISWYTRSWYSLCNFVL